MDSRTLLFDTRASGSIDAIDVPFQGQASRGTLMTVYADPRKIKISGPNAHGKCNRCDRWISLVHKTKAFPYGSKLRNHKLNGAKCWGIPTYVEDRL